MTRCPNRPGSVRKRRRDSGACGDTAPPHVCGGGLPMVVAVPVFERCCRLFFVIARPNSARTRRCQCLATFGQPLRGAPECLRGSEVALAGVTATPGVVGDDLGGREAPFLSDIGEFGRDDEIRGMRHGARV